jgi:hypothetical protein
MQQLASYLVIKQSENALCVSFCGGHADELMAIYAVELERFCQQMQGARWARIVDLRQWTVSAAPAQQRIEQLLKLDLQRGLSLEFVLPPPEIIGHWQVNKTLAQLSEPDIFHQVSNQEQALAGLENAGFSTQFGVPRRFDKNALL